MRSKLDTLIDRLQKEKEILKQDPSYLQYAYVTHDDLKNIQLDQTASNHLNMGNGEQGAQNLLLCIQTPHGSTLNLYNSRGTRLPHNHNHGAANDNEEQFLMRPLHPGA
jgi:hypothetical protein